MSMVTVVGLGLSPEDLPQAHREAIREAEVLVGARRHLDLFADQSRAAWVLGSNPEATLEEVKQHCPDKRVVILASGDPLFYGIGKRALAVFGREAVTFLPNVTALQKAFARLKLPWDGVRTISIHAREPLEFLSFFSDPGFITIYTDPTNTPARLAALLLGFGMPNRKVAVLEEIGSDEERVHETDLAGAAEEDFAALNVMVLYPSEDPLDLPVLGLPEEHFCRERSLITKRECRAVILAELQLRANGVMWDVGAGSGSVGIEAVRLAPGLQAFAVEKDGQRLRMVQENVRRLRGLGVKVVPGEAPEALLPLPNPDRVFIGGSGGRLIQILKLVEDRLRPRGRVVLSVVTPENLGRAQEFLRTTRLAYEWLLLQASRTVAIKSSAAPRRNELPLSRFQPETPLFLLCLWRV